MKKITITLLLLVVAFGTLGVSTAFAQGQQPQDRPGMGIMHEYMVAALSDTLGPSEAELDQRLLDGESMYAIALAEGIAEEDIPEFLAEVRTKAFEAAVAGGVITQDWADRMSKRMQPRSRNGSGSWTCPMGGNQPLDGTGQQYSHGMGGRGMRGWWQQNTP
jgi:fructose-specific phosphotransferase system IIC component